VTEKVSGEFAAAYCGGREDTWDVLNRNREALEGDFAAWDAMMALLTAGQGSNAAYQRVQGNNADGQRNPAYQVYLDVGDDIDYMIAEFRPPGQQDRLRAAGASGRSRCCRRRGVVACG